MGIVDDNHLVGQQYAWLTTCGTFIKFSEARDSLLLSVYIAM